MVQMLEVLARQTVVVQVVAEVVTPVVLALRQHKSVVPVNILVTVDRAALTQLPQLLLIKQRLPKVMLPLLRN